jgi:hypothetical protein
MKHLKVAACVVYLAILISCSSVPPPPTGSRSVPVAAAAHAMLAPHHIETSSRTNTLVSMPNIASS